VDIFKIIKKLFNVKNSKKDRGDIIRKCSKKYSLPINLIKAIIEVESSGNKYAIRYEPNFRWTKNIDKYSGSYQSKATEKNAQKTSWGLMQIMGGTARELGYDETFLSGLLDERTNIELGCKYLAGLRKRFSDMENSISLFDDNMVAAYNAGSPRRKENGEFVNQEYVDRIIKNWE